MNNTKQIVDSHSKLILKSSQCTDHTNTTSKVTKDCNCRQMNACPQNGHCLQTSVMFQAAVTRKGNQKTETYIGLRESEFKIRYRNHLATFRHNKDRNSTELSKYIWALKDKNIEDSISWCISSSHQPYNSSSKQCNLCLKEKFFIIYRPDLSTLNRYNQLISQSP